MTGTIGLHEGLRTQIARQPDRYFESGSRNTLTVLRVLNTVKNDKNLDQACVFRGVNCDANSYLNAGIWLNFASGNLQRKYALRPSVLATTLVNCLLANALHPMVWCVR
ncbi:MAG: hypothetical protein AB4040_19080 [Synechococcus sp.]